jgi:hypothetical protein
VASCYLLSAVTPRLRPPPNSLPNLSLLVGERIEVTDEIGSVFTGRLLRVSETSLVLEADRKPDQSGPARPTEVSLGRIHRISRWEKDSVANGIIIGALIGVATAAVIAALPDTDEPMMGYTFLPGLGIGMAIGGIGDASRHRKIPIFQAVAPRVAVAPMLTGGRKGVAVSVSF